jgi:hypothetical protein
VQQRKSFRDGNVDATARVDAGSGGTTGGTTATTAGASASGGKHSDGGAPAGGTTASGGATQQENDASIDGPSTSGTGGSSNTGGAKNSAGGNAAGGMGGLCPFLASLGTDVSSLLQPATVAKKAPMMVRSVRLDGTLALDGQLDSTSQRFPEPLDASTGCITSQSTDPTDFYAIELVGPGPHQLEIDACQSGLLVINAYQAKDGTPGAVDSTAGCAHFVASTGLYCGNGYRFVGSGFAAGTLVLTISSFEPPKSYHVELRSSTSCSGTKPAPPVEGDAATTPFIDPNPRACTAQNLGQCNYTSYDPSGGSIKWSSCCLTDFPQNPEGKCGVTGNGGPCVERMAPGNLDSSCPSGDFRVSSFPPYNIVDTGQGCCNWRTGKCGLFADTIDLGCVAIPIEISQSMPSCTPDYSHGLAL